MRIENSNVRLSIKTSNIETKVIGHRKEKLKKEERNSNRLKIEAKALKQKREENFNKMIKQLEKIKEELKKEKSNIKNAKIEGFDKLSKEEKENALKEKNEKIKILDDKIAEVDKQIQQLEIQKQKQKIEDEKEELEKKERELEKNKVKINEKQQDVVVDKSLFDLIDGLKSRDIISSLKQIRTSEKLESMFIPKGRDEKTFDSKRLKQIAQSEARININISKAIKIMSRRVKKVQNENKLIGFKGKIEDINIGERLKEEN
ncbi:MAG: hypothetical protein E7214_15855 [Clostridium sp.]|nr:hypothetical protein [Clostridium sp.]